MRIDLAVCVVAIALTIGCGPATHQIRPTGPFTPELAHVFDDSVDYVTDIGGLGGRLAQDFTNQINALSSHSDLIGVAQVETVVQGQDADGSRSYRLSANVGSLIHGDAPDDHRVQLRVSQGQTGFNTVDGQESRLQSGSYILFVKWYIDGAGDLRAHWHLSPNGDALLAQVRRASGAEAREHGEETIVRQEGSPAPSASPGP